MKESNAFSMDLPLLELTAFSLTTLEHQVNVIYYYFFNGTSECDLVCPWFFHSGSIAIFYNKTTIIFIVFFIFGCGGGRRWSNIKVNHHSQYLFN